MDELEEHHARAYFQRTFKPVETTMLELTAMLSNKESLDACNLSFLIDQLIRKYNPPLNVALVGLLFLVINAARTAGFLCEGDDLAEPDAGTTFSSSDPN